MILARALGPTRDVLPHLSWLVLRFLALHHAYGPAVDVPGHLSALRSLDLVLRDETTRASAAACTTRAHTEPFLVALVDDSAPPRMDMVLRLLSAVAIGDRHDTALPFGPAVEFAGAAAATDELEARVLAVLAAEASTRTWSMPEMLSRSAGIETPTTPGPSTSTATSPDCAIARPLSWQEQRNCSCGTRRHRRSATSWKANSWPSRHAGDRAGQREPLAGTPRGYRRSGQRDRVTPDRAARRARTRAWRSRPRWRWRSGSGPPRRRPSSGRSCRRGRTRPY
jgi:hypothetical protein